jgi:hypothetical protein
MANRWLRSLLTAISDCWECHALSLHVGFQYRRPEDKDDCWEVWAYPAVQEIVGGENDGETVWSGFNFDLSQLLETLQTEHIGISTRMHPHPPEVTLEGGFQGKAVLLHLCLEPPEDAETTEILDLTEPDDAKVREKG